MSWVEVTTRHYRKGFQSFPQTGFRPTCLDRQTDCLALALALAVLFAFGVDVSWNFDVVVGVV